MDETGSSGVDPGAEPPVEGGVEPHETGGEVVLEEAREELVRLVTHPVSELKRLEHVAEEGDSAATPLIVAVGLMLVIGLVLALALAVILLVYYGT